MTANELRIGNLVDLGNRIAKVIEINHLACVVVDLEETQDTIEDYDRTKPIPLTEECLLKFGFKYRRLGLFEAIKVYDSIGYHIYFSQVHLKEIEYVHQLQNLYFALTGEELTFKSESDEDRKYGLKKRTIRIS